MELEEQENIFNEIYQECDNNNVNNVQVSVLLTYIGPYIDSNSNHFEELKKSLDPNDLNPFIDKETFMNAMMCWSEKFKNDVEFNFNNEEISRQSSPTITQKADYDTLNLSSISGYSLTGSVLSTIDPNVLQEQNNELQHQNKRLTECLDDVKYQLTTLEEQNVALQNQIDCLQKSSQLDQKLIKTLQIKCAECEREREEHTNENKEYRDKLVLNKRIRTELEIRINELEVQNNLHVNTIEKQTDTLNEKHEQTEDLMKIISDKDAEIQEKEIECKQHQLNIERYISEINELKNHIQSLEMIVENDQDQQSTKMEPFEPELKEEENQDDDNKICGETTEARSLSPEEAFAVPLERRISTHESLLSELASISTSGCFHSCEYRVNQLEDELNKLHDELRQKNEELQDVQNKNTQLEMQLTVSNEELQDVQNKNAQLEMQLIASNKDMNDKYNMLTAELNQLKGNLEALGGVKQQMQIERKQMQSKLTYYKMANKNFKIALDTKTNEISTLRKKLKAKEDQLLSIEEMEKNIKEKLEKLNRQIALKETEDQMKNDEIRKMQQTLRVFENEMKELKEINCKLMTEISSLERAAKMERKRNTRVDLNCKVNELEEQLEMTKTKNHQLMSNISSVTLEKKQLICKLELLEDNEYSKRKVECLELKLQKYRKMVTDLENQILTKTKDYEHLNDEHKTLNEHIYCVKIALNTNIDLLKSTVYYLSDIWMDTLKDIFPDLNLVNLFNMNTSTSTSNNDLLKNEIDLLNNQINGMIILLKAFAIMKNRMTIKEKNEESSCISPNESENENKNKSLLNIRKLCSPHESSGSANKQTYFSLKPPTLQVKPKNKIHFVFPPMPELNNNENENMDDDDDNNSTFTKTYNDSYIDKILMEQRIAEPIEQIQSNEEKIINQKQLELELEEQPTQEKDEQIIKERLTRVRSLSEGASLPISDDLLAFPHLPDRILNQLNLIPILNQNQDHSLLVDVDTSSTTTTTTTTTKQHLTEEEIEKKFQTLALAFNIDALTIKRRLEVQERQRDQAEKNLQTELMKFQNIIRQLQLQQQHLYGGESSRETRELMTGLLDRVQLIVQATQRISTCAQILGSFQQEWRISDSVHLMLIHLKHVIKQRDMARKQLQLTKEMLQKNASAPILKKPTVMTTRRLTINTIPTSTTTTMGGSKNVILPPRRASIAVISQTHQMQMQQIGRNASTSNVCPCPEPLFNKFFDCKRIPRAKNCLEINPELTKIQEGSIESNLNDEEYETSSEFEENSILPLSLLKNDNVLVRVFNEWAANGTLHEICFIGTIVCFTMATILLCNTITEIELAREGAHVRQIPWKWLTWQEIIDLFFS